MSIQSLRRKYKKLQNSKVNVKALMIELFQNSSNDYTTERMQFHLYKCGMNSNEGSIYKWLLEMEVEGVVIYVGDMPIYTENNNVYIGTDPVFGLIPSLKENKQ